LPDGSHEIDSQGEVAWANPNGQSGIRFVDMDAATSTVLSQWLAANSPEAQPEEEDSVTDCKLTDLSLGGCYVQTESPFPNGHR
jgi:hypothetical protein